MAQASRHARSPSRCHARAPRRAAFPERQSSTFVALFDPERCQQGARRLGLRVKLDVDHGAVLVELKSGDRQTLIAAQPIQRLEAQKGGLSSFGRRRVFAAALTPSGLPPQRADRYDAAPRGVRLFVRHSFEQRLLGIGQQVRSIGTCRRRRCNGGSAPCLRLWRIRLTGWRIRARRTRHGLTLRLRRIAEHVGQRLLWIRH
jgi:hypothetical protein